MRLTIPLTRYAPMSIGPLTSQTSTVTAKSPYDNSQAWSGRRFPAFILGSDTMELLWWDSNSPTVQKDFFSISLIVVY